MKIVKIKVNLKERSYPIVIGKNILGKANSFLKDAKISGDAIVITNKFLKNKYGSLIKKSFKASGLRFEFLLIPDTEKAKSSLELLRLIKRISDLDENKKLFIVAFGGGVIGDLGGFAASIYKRGVPFVQIPTTLLAQIDSSIGGKTAIDLDVAKNQIGTFYQPRLVLSDVSVLASLDRRQISSGLAEAIKYSIIKDAGLFSYIQRNYKKILSADPDSLFYLVKRCSLIKSKIVSLDEKETKDLRILLNFGHTIGHSIEASGNYKSYNHGEAVAIGMLGASFISRQLDFLGEGSFKRIQDLILKVGLPARIKKINANRLFKAYLRDKKFIGKTNRFVLVRSIGNCFVKDNVPFEVVKAAVENLR